jgi:hypothetical protein
MGRAAPVTESDPADMGTAIGLDFILDQPAAEPLASANTAGPARPAESPDWNLRYRTR